MTASILPSPKLHPRSLGSRNTFPAAAPFDTATAAGTSPWIHDTCVECGFDGDVAVIRDIDEGLIGWDCPECSYFVTMRDLLDD